MTRAIDYLETLLDGDLIGVGAYHAEYVPPYTGKIMTTAAEYRTKYPRRTENAEIDAAVQRALSTGKP